MAIFRITLYVRQGGAGWSESFYLEKTDLHAAKLEVINLMKERVNCFGFGDPETPLIEYFRVKRVDDRTSFLSFNEVNLKPAQIFDRPDMPWTGVQIRFVTASDRVRVWTMRGVPDEFTLTPWARPITGNVRTHITAFANYIVNGDYRMQIQSYTGDAAIQTLQSVVVDADTGDLICTAAAAHGLVPPVDRVNFLQFQGAYLKLSGIHKVLVSSDTTFRVPGLNVRDVGFISGKFRALRYSYEDIAKFTIGRKTSHRVGRPFVPLVGRRRRQAR